MMTIDAVRLIDDAEWASGRVARAAWGLTAVAAWIAVHALHSPALAAATRLEVLPGVGMLAALALGLWVGRARARLAPAG
jgi:hypothetical protein